MAIKDLIDPKMILDSLPQGLYVCDTDRKIVYWNRSAERITGWKAEEVVGHHCLDDILAHVNKDCQPLCGKESCPLHRSIVTGAASGKPLVVLGLTKDRGRIPMEVSVSPIHDAQGQVVGGVEVFRDFSETYRDMERAKWVQTLSMNKTLPQDERLSFSSFYLAHDMIGGDYFAIQPLDADRYGFLLADVMGHGTAAALYTMCLSLLWEQHYQEITSPKKFAGLLNQELSKAVKEESFAAAICGVINLAEKTVRIASAGGPPILAIPAFGEMRTISFSGLPFGVFAKTDYEETVFNYSSGDTLLMFTDGAFEIRDKCGKELGISGLMEILKKMDYPNQPIAENSLQEELLKYSNGIQLADDLTLLEVRFI